VSDEPTHEETAQDEAAGEAQPEAGTEAEGVAQATVEVDEIEAQAEAALEPGGEDQPELEAEPEGGEEEEVEEEEQAEVDEAEAAEEQEEAEVEAEGGEEGEEGELAEAEGEAEQEPEEVAEPEGDPKSAEAAAEGEDEVEEEAAEEDEAAAEARIRVVDDGIKRRWYAIHAHSGQESNVKKSIQVLAEQAGLEDLIANVLVPMENVAEIKSGQKRISKRKFFPGYVLVQLPEHPEGNPELWHLIKDTPGVTGFIGSRSVPVPLEDAEVEAILEEIRGERERPKPKVKFESGERVKIIDGPFSNFLGNIDEINLERGKLKVMVEIFERLTSVEVEFWQVEKI